MGSKLYRPGVDKIGLNSILQLAGRNNIEIKYLPCGEHIETVRSLHRLFLED